jgi:simple sugar transport system permease protein
MDDKDVSSMLAGLGGAYRSIAYSPNWIEGMAAGRGWLTMALVNFALRIPIHGIPAAYLFGIFCDFSCWIETMGIAVPSDFRA